VILQVVPDSASLHPGYVLAELPDSASLHPGYAVLIVMVVRQAA